ncbi:MAG: ribosome biogenesis GTPase Der [Proteobacteria bacterium]|nr:MAG: ribosome biogenesis GTPase Der [Pseudomonadota bacterium]
MRQKLPSLVIVGRPNVGKSTLFNRLTGTRRSIVTNEPGITRDRIYGKAEWRGRTLEVVDTGGIIPEEKALIPKEIFRQARLAIEKASLLVLVVDSQAGPTPLDADLARLLRGTGKPFFVAVNKVDAPRQEVNAAAFHELGAPVFPITAEHGTGVDDLLDQALERIDAERRSAARQQAPAPEHELARRPGPASAVPAQASDPRNAESHAQATPPRPQHLAAREPWAGLTAAASDAPSGAALDESAELRERVSEEQKPEIEVAIIGRPNVGKSTLLNRLVGEERAIVSPIPGTTMDSVDTEVVRDGRTYCFVDTAGIRRKGKTVLVAEKLSVVMARRGLERADVALLVVDAEQGVTQGDATIAMYAEQSGRSVIIVMNKWDLAVEAARKAAQRESRTAKGKALEARGPRAGNDIDRGLLLYDYEKLVRNKLKFLSYAPMVFLSAKSGERANKLYPLINQVAEARRRRIPTPDLNRWLKEIDLGRGTTPKARPVKIYYVTQAKTAPPTFLLFTNQKQPLHFSYERFLENQLRAKFDFTGTPVRFVQRVRKRERD